MIMSDSPGVSNFIRPPGRPPCRQAPPVLALPKRAASAVCVTTRSPFALLDASQEARRQIAQVVAMIRAADVIGDGLGNDRSAELMRSLEAFEMRLAEREQALDEREFRMADQQRELAESNALLSAREALLIAQSKLKHPRPALSPEEKTAIARLKGELDRQEIQFFEGKEALRAREAFLDQSEMRLFGKVQEHQEKETELEQREEELKAREEAMRLRESRLDPVLAATLQAESAPKRFDEFKE